MNTAAGRPDPDARREDLRARLLALGFDEVRFAATGHAGADLGAWLASGHQADMQWMGRTAAKRLDPELVLAGTQSMIVLGISYAGSEIAPAQQRPRWARYALHDDYHDSVKKGLVRAGKVLEAWGGIDPGDHRYYVDTGPVMERGWAARSGLGFRGKNGMLISRRHGNWLFLAAILTRARIAPDEPLRPQAIRLEGAEPAGLLCGKCTRCLDACPTAAFPQPGVVDSRRCISYHTIENRGIIPREFRRGIGDRVYGCDICLEVCPWNRFAAAARRVLLSVRADIAQLDLAQLLGLTPERFASLFKGTAIKRLKLTGLLRNACVVAGNTSDAAHVPALVRLAAHDSPVVRAHAVWAVRQLAGERAGVLLAAAQAHESDPTVLAEYAS